jgi:hypothetical protein
MQPKCKFKIGDHVEVKGGVPIPSESPYSLSGNVITICYVDKGSKPLGYVIDIELDVKTRNSFDKERIGTIPKKLTFIEDNLRMDVVKNRESQINKII